MNIHDATEAAYKRGYEDGQKDGVARTTIELLPWLRLVYEDGKLIGWYNPRLRRALK